jgi:serine/threonine protein kinase
MELLEGRTLQDMLRDAEKMPVQKAPTMPRKVADGLDHAHYFAIVHRDVKPAEHRGLPGGRAKLTDFGVAYIPFVVGDACRASARLAEVHVARAGARPADRSALGRLFRSASCSTRC